MSISGGGGWGASESLGGPNRSNERSGGDGGGGTRSNRERLSKQQFESLFGGGGSNNAPSRSGNGGNTPAKAQQQGSLSMRSSLAELNRRDRAAVAAYNRSGVNVASDVFNDDEEGINSFGEAIDRIESWIGDRFGVNNPGGFIGSNAASGLATAAGFMLGGIPGAAIASTGLDIINDPKPSRNAIGYGARVLGGVLPGIGGLAASGVATVDEYVADLDKVRPSDLGGIAGATATASANTPGLTNFPGGKQGGDNIAPPAKITSPVVSKTSNGGASSKTATSSRRRTFSPLNLRFAALRGLPTVEELL